MIQTICTLMNITRRITQSVLLKYFIHYNYNIINIFKCQQLSFIDNQGISFFNFLKFIFINYNKYDIIIK
jgi:hypothetical protein